MKTIRIVLALCAGLFLFSCKKNNDNPSATPDPFQLPYNKISVENNKAFLEKEGRDFIKKIEDLPNLKGIDVLEVLADLNAPDINFEQRQIINIGRKSQKAGAVLKVATEINKPSSRKKGLNELFGIFTYDRANDKWIETASDDKLSFIFPSTSNGSTNDASLTLTYKSSGIVLAPQDDEDSYELPSEITGSLQVGAETLLTVSSAHSYYSDGLPKTTDTKIVLGAYSFANLFKNENNIIDASLSISKSDSKLIEWTVSSKNKSFNLQQLENAERADEILGEANSIVTIGNVKIATWADIGQFAANEKEFEYPDWGTYFENVNWDNEQEVNNAYRQFYQADAAVQKEEANHGLALYKQYSKAVVVNTLTNELLCSIDYAVKEETNCQQYYTEEICTTDTYLEPILVFGDSSKVNFEVFGDTGFENLKTDYENFADRF